MGQQSGPTSQYLSKSSELIGKSVTNPQGEKLGKISELVIDILNGRIAYAVLDSSGIQGMGDKLFAVPMDAIQPQNKGQQLVLNVSKEKMAQAPGFNRNQWPNMANPEWGTQVYLFYGIEPYAAVVTQHPVIPGSQPGSSSTGSIGGGSTGQGGMQQPSAQGSQTLQGTTGQGAQGGYGQQPR